MHLTQTPQALRESVEFRDMAKDLADLLDIKLNQTNIIPESLQSKSARERLNDMMNVIEKILKFIEASIDIHSLGKLLVAALCTFFTERT